MGSENNETRKIKRFEIEVEKVNGYCTYSYKEGDTFIFNGFDTPNGFCGGAYTTLFPIIVALHSGARFNFEKIPCVKRRWHVLIMGTLFLKSGSWMSKYLDRLNI